MRVEFNIPMKSNQITWPEDQGCHPKHQILLGQWSQVLSYEPRGQACCCPQTWHVLLGGVAVELKPLLGKDVCSWRTRWAPKRRRLELTPLLDLSACKGTFAFKWRMKGRERMLLGTRLPPSQLTEKPLSLICQAWEWLGQGCFWHCSWGPQLHGGS